MGGTPLLTLEAMGHLVSVKVSVSDVVEFTENRTVDIQWVRKASFAALGWQATVEWR